jgi:tyrosyl-tRNA synthetase
MSLSVDEKVTLITRGLDEVMGAEKAVENMKTIIAERDLKLYWGTATTGAPHIAYFVPMSKIADFLRAGCEVTILFADLHAYLDNQKAPWDLLMARTKYYELVIKSMLKSIGVPLEKLKFVRGTDYQLSREFSLDVYKLTAMTSERNAKKAGAEVVKQVESPFLSGMLYPLLQALDEEYLHVDAQFGGVDQRKIFTYAETFLPKIGYAKRVHLMNPMVPSLTGGKGNKMSASDPNSKIDLLDSRETVEGKIRKAFADPGVVEGNGLLAFTKRVLFPLSADGTLTIAREEKHGGDLHFASYEALEAAYADKSLFPLDLKNGVAAAINKLLDPIRAEFSTPEMQAVVAAAYPKGDGHEIAPEADIELDGEGPETAAAAAPAAAGAAGAAPEGEFYKCDFRVGRLQNVRCVEGSDKLYILEADIGHAEGAVQVVTNVRQTMAIDELEGKHFVLLANLKPASFMGNKTFAMLLGGASEDGASSDLLVAPEGAKAGDRLYLTGQRPVEGVIARANEKVIKSVYGALRTDAEKQLTWDGKRVLAAGGAVASPAIANAVFHSK